MGVYRLSKPGTLLTPRATSSSVLPPGSTSIPFEYLIIAGGGGGGRGGTQLISGPGGAGGFRNSVAGELTGGGGPAEVNPHTLTSTLTITVGAGGAENASGSFSEIGGITSIGGGSNTNAFSSQLSKQAHGGSGAGGSVGVNVSNTETGGLRVPAPIQGNNGGAGRHGNSDFQASGGGGGAGAAGGNAVNNQTGGAGGVGIASSITLSSVFRAGGGGGGTLYGGSRGLGGNGGGGNGGTPNVTGGAGGSGASGTANTGGGGGCGSGQTGVGGAGGSGVVILRYAASNPNLTVGAGLVIDNGSGGNVSGAGAPLTPSFSDATWKVYMFKSGTGTVTL